MVNVMKMKEGEKRETCKDTSAGPTSCHGSQNEVKDYVTQMWLLWKYDTNHMELLDLYKSDLGHFHNVVLNQIPIRFFEMPVWTAAWPVSEFNATFMSLDRHSW